MNITITGRRITVSDRLSEYAEKKMQKLESYFDQLIDARIILSVEKLDHMAEVLINGDGVQFYGREKADTLYSAIDLLFEKMEKQINRYKEKHSAHKGPDKRTVASIDFTNEQGRDLRLVQVSNKPTDNIEAYLQMKVNKSDFILFKKGVSEVDSNLDYSNKNYAVLYNDGSAIKMIEIPFDKIRENVNECDTFIRYDLRVIRDSATDPEIKFIKEDDCDVQSLTLDDAYEQIESGDERFLPFFNIETQYFNILYKNGSEYEVLVPAF